MKLQLSQREKILVFMVFLSVVFFCWWQYYLNPLLNKGINSNIIEIANLKTQIANLKTAEVKSAAAAKLAKKEEIKIYPKDEQLNYVMRFLDRKFRWFGVKLISFSNTPGEDYITINIKFEASPYQLVGLLNSLPQAKTALMIDSAGISSAGSKLVCDMRVLSYFRKE